MSAGVVICGGGTGGHINPGLAVAMELDEMGIPVSWLGTAGGMEERLVPDAGVPLHTVRFATPSGGILGRLACMLNLPRAALAARKVLREVDAKVVLGLGGYPSLPGVFASLGGLARRLIHEQNVIPGLANRLLAPFAHRVLTSHPGTLPSSRAQVTGNPIRRQFSVVPEPQERFAGREGPLRLLVIGGSQGAITLNKFVPATLGQMDVDWRVEHAAGESAVDSTVREYEKASVPAEVKAYFPDVDSRMASADLVICRAGAATIAELACVGVASILVPYPHARAHQKANAATLVDAGAAVDLADEAMSKQDRLAGLLAEMASRDKLLGMAVKARSLARADAAKEVALACEREMRSV